MFYPLKFHPIFKERIWGGRELERLFQKPLPPEKKIGESWELVDRAEDCSVIANGRYANKTLHWLIEHHAKEILGDNGKPTPSSASLRFPLLVKWLDARDLLSVQVHPPVNIAPQLKGEPKTEMWWITDAEKGAEIYFGLKRGVTQTQFHLALNTGKVAELLHRSRAKRGDVFFIPSGRVHALGSGIVLLEIQQNSDTTYRVFDWNRKDASGKPRELHIEKALESIDFTDYEPAPSSAQVSCPHFTAHQLSLTTPHSDRCDRTKFQILAQLSGASVIASRTMPPHEGFQERLNAGEVALLPAAMGDYRIEPLNSPCELMKVTL